MAPLLAYVYSTLAGFYEILAGHLIKETMPVPVTAEEAQQQYEVIQAKAAETEEETEKKGTEEEKTTEEEVKATETEIVTVTEEETPGEDEK